MTLRAEIAEARQAYRWLKYAIFSVAFVIGGIVLILLGYYEKSLGWRAISLEICLILAGSGLLVVVGKWMATYHRRPNGSYPHCGIGVFVDAAMAGRMVQCGNCLKSFGVPKLSR